MTTDAAATRWGDGRRADSDFAREQILDAAWHCYQENSVYRTSMEHIAREAKVSRTTIYRYFQNRDEVLSGVLLREARTFTEQMHLQLRGVGSLAEYIVEVLAYVVERAPESPIFSVLMREGTPVLSRIGVASDEIFAIASKTFQERFERAQAAGELRDGVLFIQFVDWVAHILAAYILAPSPLRGSKEWKQMLWRFLVPAIVRDEANPLDKK